MLLIIITLSLTLVAGFFAIRISIQESRAVDSVDGISVDDLVKFENGPLFRIDNIIRDDRGQWIIVEDHMTYVVDRDTPFVIWS